MSLWSSSRIVTASPLILRILPRLVSSLLLFPAMIVKPYAHLEVTKYKLYVSSVLNCLYRSFNCFQSFIVVSLTGNIKNGYYFPFFGLTISICLLFLAFKLCLLLCLSSIDEIDIFDRNR